MSMRGIVSQGPHVAGLFLRQYVADCIRDRARSVAIQPFIDFLESANQVEHMGPGIRASSGGAKMRAATKRPGFVDQTATAARIKQWTRSIQSMGKALSSCGTQGFGGDERLAARKLRGFSCEVELAALCPQAAIAL